MKNYYKTFLAVCLHLSLVVNLSAGCCSAGRVSFFPSEGIVKKESLIMVNLTGVYSGYYTMLDRLDFYAVTEDGKREALLLHDQSLGANQMAQLLFKVTGEVIVAGETFKIKVEGVNLKWHQAETFLKYFDQSSWVFTNETDTTPPEFIGGIKYEYRSFWKTTISGYSVRIKLKFREEGIDYDFKDAEIAPNVVAQVIDANGAKYYFPVQEGEFVLSQSICGAAFSRDANVTCEYRVKLFDLSGNFSEKTNLLLFDTSL